MSPCVADTGKYQYSKHMLQFMFCLLPVYKSTDTPQPPMSCVNAQPWFMTSVGLGPNGSHEGDLVEAPIQVDRLWQYGGRFVSLKLLSISSLKAVSGIWASPASTYKLVTSTISSWLLDNSNINSYIHNNMLISHSSKWYIFLYTWLSSQLQGHFNQSEYYWRLGRMSWNLQSRNWCSFKLDLKIHEFMMNAYSFSTLTVLVGWHAALLNLVPAIPKDSSWKDYWGPSLTWSSL